MRSLKDFEAKIFDKVNPAINFSVTRYVFSIGIFAAFFLFGIWGMFNLGVDLLPSVTFPVVNVSTSYSGASPTVMDQQVTQVIENAVSTLSGITDLNSSSSIGSSRVQISLDPSVDRNAALNQVASLVNAASRRLPAALTSAPVVRSFDQNSQPVLQFGVDGGGAKLSDVAQYVQDSLAPMLERTVGVANITLSGAPSRQFQVLLDPSLLQYNNVSPTQVVNAITGSALNQPIGSIVTNGSSLTFSTQNQPANIAEINRILVDPTRGIAVSNLGVVRDVSVDSDYARINGIPMVLVSLQRTNESNAVAVVDDVKKVLSDTKFPAGYSVIYSNDTTGPIRASVDSTYRELWLSLLVVALIVLLFVGKPNMAFSVILAIPIALAASPILYTLAGFSLNLVSMLAMVIAIGIVVDDSIVVAENVERYRSMGFPLKESVLRGASEVFSAVIAASLSLLSVLIPVSFIGGYIARYLQQFALGLAAAVLFSLFEAILFLTVRLAYTPEGKEIAWPDFLRSFTRLKTAMKWGFSKWYSGFGILSGLVIAIGIGVLLNWQFLVLLVFYPAALGLLNYVIFILYALLSSLTKTCHGWTEFVLGKIRDAYTRSLATVLRQGIIILIACGIFLAAISLVIVPHIPFNFIPITDSGFISVQARFPSGTPQLKMNEISYRIENFLRNQKEIMVMQTTVGNSAETIAELTPVGTRPNITDVVANYRKLLQALFRDTPSVSLSVRVEGNFGGFGGSSLQFNVVAADFSLLRSRNAALIDAIQQNPWVADVTSSLSDTILENNFEPDPNKLKGTGLTTQNIANVLQTYTSGTQASNVIDGGLAYPIQVMINPSFLKGGQTLQDLPIYSSVLQSSLQVGQLGNFILRDAPISISRYNRQYTGTLNINLKPGAPTALELQNSLTKDLVERGLIGGGVDFRSSSRFSQAALAGQLLDSSWKIFLIALFLAYLVMAAQFNSWRYPIYLLMPVPLAVVGALVLVWAVGGGIDIFGLMGMLMLIGLSAKNAILYLDFVMERMPHMPLKEALIESAQLRFRPIVMTTLTVLVISFPLIFSGGQGAEFGQRMGIVMLGGIVFSAILTFFVVPAAFYLFERKRAAVIYARESD